MDRSHKSNSTRRLPAWSIAIFTVLFALSLAEEANPRFQDQATSRADKNLSVRISPKHKTLRPGENLVLHVEIVNQGPQDIFIFKEIELGCCAWSELHIYVQNGEQFEGPGSAGSIEDSLRFGANNPNKPPFANALSRGWIALPPGYSYSKDLFTYSLRRPGKYQIGGTYVSHGMSGELQADYSEEINHLPYQAWKGAVDTNTIWIEVVRAGSQANVKKSP